MSLNYESSEKIELSSVVKIFKNSLSVKSKTDTGDIAIINASNISDNGIDYEHLNFVSNTDEKHSKYFLQENDILLLAKGADNKVSVFKEQKFQCVPSNSLIVLRPDTNKINPFFLSAFLQSSTGKTLLNNIKTGVASPTITLKNLSSLQIPSWSLSEQEEWLSNNK